MEDNKSDTIIVMADDDDDDYMLTSKALRDSKLLNTLYRVKDGEELVQYLSHQAPFDDVAKYPRPDVILLDLNMPRKDGREALKEIKSNPKINNIPIVVFTTSQAEEDIYKTYQLGVNSFITKPVTFDKLVEVMQTLGDYWFKIVTLPHKDDGPSK